MRKLLNELKHKTDKREYIIIFGILYFVFQFLIVYVLNDLSVKEVIKLQMLFSSDAFIDILKLWNEADLIKFYKRHFLFDFFLPIWYGIFLISLMSKLFNANQVNQKLNYFLMLPFFAGIFDIFENILHLIVLCNLDVACKVLIGISQVFSTLKWLLVLVSLIIILIMCVKYYVRK